MNIWLAVALICFAFTAGCGIGHWTHGKDQLAENKTVPLRKYAEFQYMQQVANGNNNPFRKV
jgi:hypothetical protein